MMGAAESQIARLKRRIQKDLLKKKLIGDIIINHDEYALLINHFRNKCKRLSGSSSSSFRPDPVFAVALVQIGIKHYDRDYWGHVAHILEMSTVPQSHRDRIADVFFSTLRKYDMTRFATIAKTIRMHCFVSDHYAANLFHYLFAFYRIDLERDISRLDREMINNLFNVIVWSDNADRSRGCGGV